MAFEDRSSPNAAVSPSSQTTLNCINSPNSPESTRTSPYTCTTIPQISETSRSVLKKADPERSFLRITSYALSSPATAKSSETIHFLNSNEEDSSDATNKEKDDESNQEPTIQHLKYSIRNILQPDFGKRAVQKTKPSTKITFKPYENAPQRSNVVAPLGSLCQTVSQIGKEPESRPKSPGVVKPCLESPEETSKSEESKLPTLWPAWVYCTRYSDRPSSGPRSRRIKKTPKPAEEKRPRTAFSGAQLARLKHEFAENRYLTEKRRQQLSQELGLNEAQIKIWFQNKRAKIKKSSGQKHPLALQLMAQGLYNHSTVACDEDDIPLSS